MLKVSEPPTLLLGGSGFLGTYFAKSLPTGSVIHVSSLEGNSALDGKITKLGRFHNETAILGFLKKIEFKNVVNCVALANIEDCEKNSSLANWLNVELPGVVAKYCSSIGAKMIHISTDAVFDGKSPFRSESELPSPVSNYGRTKLEGENLVLNILPQSIIARVNFFGYSPMKESLFHFFYSRMKSKEKAIAYRDVFFTPNYAAETVRLILELSEKNQSGVFHVVGNQRISKYEFAMLISNIFELDPIYIAPVEAPLAHMERLRGHDLSLNNQKLKAAGIFPHDIEDGLRALKLEMESVNAT